MIALIDSGVTVAVIQALFIIAFLGSGAFALVSFRYGDFGFGFLCVGLMFVAATVLVWTVV